MSTEKFSILLEIVSFFLVTLDLFGKERLNDLYNRIISNLHRKKPVNLTGGFLKRLEDFSFGQHLFGILGILTGVIISMFSGFFKALIPENSSFSDFFSILIIIAIPFAIILIIINGLFILDWLVNVTLGKIVKLLNRHKLEGIMLVIGTIFFLASKIIVLML